MSTNSGVHQHNLFEIAGHFIFKSTNAILIQNQLVSPALEFSKRKLSLHPLANIGLRHSAANQSV